MVTLKPVIALSDKRADGTIPVRIRVTYKGQVRRISTNLVCTTTDLTRSGKIKNADIMAKAQELTEQMRKIVNDLPLFEISSEDVDYVVGKIKDALTGKRFHLDYFEWADRYLVCKSEPTRALYITSLNALSRYLGKRELDINDITRAMLLDFVDWVDETPVGHYDHRTGKVVPSRRLKAKGGASSRFIMKLAHIFNAAKDRYNDEDTGRILIPRSPFAKISITPPPSQGQKPLSRELIQRIIKAQTASVQQRRALDAFVVSFGLMGVNLVDMYSATPCKDVWVYNRTKTKTRRHDQAEMRVVIPDEIKPFIERLQDGSKGWMFPVIHNLGKRHDDATRAVNDGLALWCKANGIPVFTFYAARHSWATIARQEKIEKATIADSLCHIGEHAVTDIYAEKNWELMAEANKKVLSLFEWE